MWGILYEGGNKMKRFVCLLLIMAMLMSLGYSTYAENEGAVRDDRNEYEEFKKKVVGSEVNFLSSTIFQKELTSLILSDYFSEGIKYKKDSATVIIKIYLDGKSYNISDIVPGLNKLEYTVKSSDFYAEIIFGLKPLDKLRSIDNELYIDIKTTAIIQESAIVKSGNGGYGLSYGRSGRASSDRRDIFLYDSNDIKVVWDDDNDRDGLRPSDPIYLELSGLGSGNNLYKFIKAPQRPESEQDLKFTNRPSGFREDKLNGQAVDEYEIISKKNDDGSYVLTYKHKPATVDIPINIEWDDNDNEMNIRPSSVTVEIKPAASNNSTRAASAALGQNREAQDENTVSAAENWTKTFKKYKNDNGREIEYNVDAQDVDGYKKEITKTRNTYTVKYTSLMKKIQPIAKRSVIAKKVWLGGTKDEHKEAVLTLYRQVKDGAKVKVNGTVDIKKADATNSNNTSEVRSEYVYTWKDLDATDTNGNEYIFTVDEEKVPEKYEKTVDDTALTITNTRKPDPKPEVKPEAKEERTIDYVYKEDKPRQEIRELDLYRFYVLGDGDGKFRPHCGIKRSEIAQIFANILDYDKANIPLSYKAYKDVKEGAWYYDAVQKTSAKGIFAGYDDGEFKPDKEITQAELIATIKRYQELADEKENIMNIEEAHWAKNEINAAAKKNWLEIYQKHIADFDPDRVITREEVVSILNRAFERPLDKKYIDEMKDSLKGYLDVDNSMWSYYDVVSASNTYLVDASDEKNKDKWVNHAVQDDIAMAIDKIKWHKALRNDARLKEVLREVKFKR